MATKYDALAASILSDVGGESNVSSVVNCATRLRFKIVDREKVNKAKIEGTGGVIAVVEAGGQFQVVVGNNVPLVLAEIHKLSPKLAGGSGSEEAAPSGNLMNRAVDLISGIFSPILWPLAASGLLKAFLGLFVKLGWLDVASQSYTILAATADAVFYFLPIFLAVTAAKRFKASQFTSMAIAGALVYPSIVALNAEGTPVSFFGIPVIMVSYVSAVIPIIFAVWVQGHLERLVNRIMPSSIRNFMTPMISLLLLVPLTLIVIGPLSSNIGNAVSDAIMWIWGLSPFVAGALVGGFWQVFVIFGIHWGFVPVMLNDIANQGYSLIFGPLMPAVLAQGGAVFAVFLKTRNRELKELAGTAAVSAFAAGITEPAIYGVNLRLKKPFIFGCIGGAVGGAIVAGGGSTADAFVFPGLLTIPAFLNIGSTTMFAIGTVLAVAIGFTLTMVLGFTDVDQKAVIDPETDRLAGDEGELVPVTPVAGGVATMTKTAVMEVQAPVSGTLVDITTVKDPLFSTGALGQGVGIVPSSGQIVAPLDGVLVTVMPHAFGIAGENGVEVLVHVGIDTVNMAGKGFTNIAKRGQRVTHGDLITEVDLAEIKKAGYDTTTMVLVTNTAAYEDVKPSAPGAITAGDPVLTVTA